MRLLFITINFIFYIYLWNFNLFSLVGRVKYLLLLLLLMGCGEEKMKVYHTSCPEVELGEYIGYLSIEGVDQEKIGYWGCVGSNCSGTYIKEYGVRVDPMGDDTLKVCCGGRFGRVDKVNVVIIK